MEKGEAPYDEKQLFDRIAMGDGAAFSIVYRHFLHIAGGAVLALVKSEHALAEVLQEAFLRIWLNRDKIRDLDNPGGWARRIIINEAYRLLQKQGLQTKRLSTLSSQGSTVHHEAALSLELSETRELVADALTQLSPRQLMIYRMSREQHKKIPEIAGELSLSEDYVKKTLGLALQKIRKRLTDAGKLLPVILFPVFF